MMNTVEPLEDFYPMLNNIVNAIPTADKTIILGDLNIQVVVLKSMVPH